MKIGIVGGGPAGMYFALLMKNLKPTNDIHIVEQNPAGATFGFGVVFSDRALDEIQTASSEIYQKFYDSMELWDDLVVAMDDQKVHIDGNGFSGIARIELLNILQRECELNNIIIDFETRVDSLVSFSDCDVIVAADGIGSGIREAYADHFRPQIRMLSNKFVWYGTPQRYDALTLTFRNTERGSFVGHHYRYSPEMSTFIVECDTQTWDEYRFEEMTDEESRRVCEQVFAADLGDHGLVMNKSVWRNFPVVTNTNWYHENIVLIGDALRSVHFSIGSGTRMAMEDAIALHKAFEACGDDVSAALAQYETDHRPRVDKFMEAAANSYNWYEVFREKMHMDAYEIAYDYMMRSGRVDHERLAKMAPKFVKAYEEHMSHA